MLQTNIVQCVIFEEIDSHIIRNKLKPCFIFVRMIKVFTQLLILAHVHLFSNQEFQSSRTNGLSDETFAANTLKYF